MSFIKKFPPTISEKLNAALSKCLVESDCFRVRGPQVGYRNKVCYSIVFGNNNKNNNDSDVKDIPTESSKSFFVSDQAMPILNEISTFINSVCEEFVMRKIDQGGKTGINVGNDDDKSNINSNNTTARKWLDFFVEVTAKITRKNEVMIKLAVTDDCSEDFLSQRNDGDDSSSSSSCFVSKIVTKYPMIRCFVLHIAPPGLRKGTKFGKAEEEEDDEQQQQQQQRQEGKDSGDGSRYVAIFENRSTLTDLTPNGVPVQISADSFTEINYFMEDEMHTATLEFLKIPPIEKKFYSSSEEAQRKGRFALFMGRDCNVQYLSLQHYFGDRVFLTTGCPRAFRDAQAMDLPNFASVAKDKISEAIFGHAFLEIDRLFDNNNNNNNNNNQNDILHLHQRTSSSPKWDFIITAGRHGIVPTASEALIADHVVSKIANFIYTSCNVDSLTRDLHVFRRAYVIANVRSFDFFPGTRYTMTMVHLIPRRLYQQQCGGGEACQIQRNLLILPIGLPGCGKSSCSGAFRTAMEEGSDPENQKKWTKVSVSSNNNNSNSNSSGKNVPPVKRALNRRREKLTCSVFERDVVFHQQRSIEGKSLSSTKSEVHNQLVKFLSGMQTTAKEQRKNGNYDDDDDALKEQETENRGDRGGIFILDSSNGSIEQRQQYIKMWRESLPPSVDEKIFRPAIEIYFQLVVESPSSSDCNNSNNEENNRVHNVLVDRCLKRENHPAFPSSDRELAQKKIEAISKAIEPSESCFVIRQNVGSRNGDKEEETPWQNTFEQFCWISFLSYFTCNHEIPITKMILKETGTVKLA